MSKEYRAKVFKSGNSLALRLPKALGLEEGTVMVLREERAGFLLEPEAAPRKMVGKADIGAYEHGSPTNPATSTSVSTGSSSSSSMGSGGGGGADGGDGGDGCSCALDDSSPAGAGLLLSLGGIAVALGRRARRSQS